MRKNLFLTGAIAILVLAFMGCENPTDMNVTAKPDGAPAVDATTIVTEVLRDNKILVTWKDAEENGNYQVWRREIKNGEVVEGSAVKVADYVSKSPVKKIPYHQELASNTQKDTIYQYGIVNVGYQNVGDVNKISDIIWQEDGKTVTGKGPLAPQVYTAPTTDLTTTLTPNVYNVSGDAPALGTGQQRQPASLTASISGMQYGYSYSVSLQYSNNAQSTTAPGWHSSSTYFFPNSSTSLSLEQYIDQKNGVPAVIYFTADYLSSLFGPLELNLANPYTPTQGTVNRKAARLYITVTANTSILLGGKTDEADTKTANSTTDGIYNVNAVPGVQIPF